MTRARLELVTLENLADGQAWEAVDRELARLREDVQANWRRGGKRSVTLKIEMEPKVDKESGENFPEVSYSVDTKFPKVKGAVKQCQIDDRGVVMTVVGRTPVQQRIEELLESSDGVSGRGGVRGGV